MITSEHNNKKPDDLEIGDGSEGSSGARGKPRNHDFGKRLKKRRQECGLFQEQLASKIGATKNTIQRYEAGEIPKGSYLLELADVLECSIDWLLAGKSAEISASNGNFAIIMKAEARLNAGSGSVVLSEDLGKGHAFRKEWLNKQVSDISLAILLDVEGDSMETTIADGSTVMIDQSQKDIRDGSVYAIGINDLIMIKRLEMRPGGKVRVISDNRSAGYEPFEASIDDLRIIGRVIWTATSL